jgi:hypothetical protein
MSTRRIGDGRYAPERSSARSSPADHRLDLAAVARELHAAEPMAILRWGLERYGADLVIAWSGSDDVALIDMASRTGLPFSVVVVDTGRLHPDTYEYMAAPSALAPSPPASRSAKAAGGGKTPRRTNAASILEPGIDLGANDPALEGHLGVSVHAPRFFGAQGIDTRIRA